MNIENITIQHPDFPIIHYSKSGAGPLLILLHGFPETGSLWNQVIPLLRDEFTVIAPDIPSAGKSRMAAHLPFTLIKISEFINIILEHEGHSSAVIAGHSMGGYILAAYASQFPEKLKGMSFVHSSVYADTPEKIENREKAISLMEKGGHKAFVQNMIPALFAPKFAHTHKDLIKLQIERALQLPADAMIQFYRAMIGRKDYTELLRQISCPVQWIAGKEDNILPVETVLSQAHLPHISFQSVYENTGHMSMLENPKKLSEDLAVFTRYCYNP